MGVVYPLLNHMFFYEGLLVAMLLLRSLIITKTRGVKSKTSIFSYSIGDTANMINFDFNNISILQYHA